MKNAVFGLIAIVLVVFNGVAQEKKDINQKAVFENASLITSFNKEITEYKFLTLIELNEEVEQIINEFDFNNSENTKQNACEITIQIKIEVTIGVAKGLFSGSIISSCADAVASTKRLKAMLLAAAMV